MNIQDILQGAPITIIKATKDSAGYLYVEVRSDDAKNAKVFLKQRGWDCVNDMTYVDTAGKPTGTRLLSFLEWEGTHPTEQKFDGTLDITAGYVTDDSAFSLEHLPFSNTHIPDNEIPKGKKRLSIRHSDEDDSIPATLERYVCANHFGDVLVDEKTARQIICEMHRHGGFLVIQEWNFN